MNKRREIFNGGLALLFSPFILLGAIGHIVKFYIIAGVDIMKLGHEALEEWFEKYD